MDSANESIILLLIIKQYLKIVMALAVIKAAGRMDTAVAILMAIAMLAMIMAGGNITIN
jgi:hypothetical protein